MKEKTAITLFKGFTPESILFLEQVRAKNSKKWFEAHRGEYEEYLLVPLRALVSSLSSTIIGIDSGIETTPAINRTISRIYRDTRFSKDKSLFRSEAWISFKRRTKEKVTVPEFYFYVTPEAFEFGMGYYAADRASMDRFRAAITRNPAAFRKAISSIEASRHKLERLGDGYRRVIANEAPADLQDWFQLKSFHYRVHRKTSRKVYSAALAGEIAGTYTELGPLYRFLIENTL